HGYAPPCPPTTTQSARAPWAPTPIRGPSPTRRARSTESRDSRSPMLRSCRRSPRRPRTSPPSWWLSTLPEDSGGSTKVVFNFGSAYTQYQQEHNYLLAEGDPFQFVVNGAGIQGNVHYT